MRPRARDIIGAAMLAAVLFTLVAVMFIAAIGERDRAPTREATLEPVATGQL